MNRTFQFFVMQTVKGNAADKNSVNVDYSIANGKNHSNLDNDFNLGNDLNLDYDLNLDNYLNLDNGLNLDNEMTRTHDPTGALFFDKYLFWKSS